MFGPMGNEARRASLAGLVLLSAFALPAEAARFRMGPRMSSMPAAMRMRGMMPSPMMGMMSSPMMAGRMPAAMMMSRMQSPMMTTMPSMMGTMPSSMMSPMMMSRTMQASPGTLMTRAITTPQVQTPQVQTPQVISLTGPQTLAQQAINQNFRVGLNTTIGQAAFNISTIGQALRQVPRDVFAFNRFGAGVGVASNPYLMGGYGGYGGSGGYGGYGGGMMSGYGGSSLTTPYTSAATYDAASTDGSSANYPLVATSASVGDARLTLPAANTTLVSNAAPDRPSNSREIWIYDNSFSPPTTMVPAGTIIRWINYGYGQHTVTSLDRLWDSGPMRRGAEFSITLKEPGTYRYVCRYHSGEMVATIVVSK